MKGQGYIVLAAAMSALVGLTACGQTPTTSPTGNQTRHYTLASTGISFAEIFASLPKSIPVDQAKDIMVRIDPKQVARVDRRKLMNVYGRGGMGMGMGMSGLGVEGLGNWGAGTFGTWGNNQFGIGRPGTINALADANRIGTNIPQAFTDRIGSLSYLPYGNMRIPYEQYGTTLQPYVVDRQAVPFFIENTTIAIPKVTQVARQVQVPKAVTVQQPVTVQQAVPVQRTVAVPQIVNTQAVVQVPQVVTVPQQVNVPVNVTEVASVPVQTTIPVEQTVLENATVLENQVNQTFARTSAVIGPSGQMVPFTYNGVAKALGLKPPAEDTSK